MCQVRGKGSLSPAGRVFLPRVLTEQSATPSCKNILLHFSNAWGLGNYFSFLLFHLSISFFNSLDEYVFVFFSKESTHKLFSNNKVAEKQFEGKPWWVQQTAFGPWVYVCWTQAAFSSFRHHPQHVASYLHGTSLVAGVPAITSVFQAGRSRKWGRAESAFHRWILWGFKALRITGFL